MVSRILQDESYTGTPICHKSERNKINKTFRVTVTEEQFRHENFLPPIISKELWEQTQCLLSARKQDNVRASPNKPIHRYSGLLRCRDCGRTFVGKRIKLKSSERIEYICDTYLRYSKEHCTSHAVEETTLDRLIEKELRETKRIYQKNWNALDALIERWTPKESLAGTQIKKLSDRAGQLEEEVEAILMERIWDAALTKSVWR